MINITLHKNDTVYRGKVEGKSNLVVLAGIHKFPHPNLSYRCGMGRCGTCACRVITGNENLPPPNWKEIRRLGPYLDQGYRLACQMWLTHDTELTQDVEPLPSQAEISKLSETQG